MKRFISLITILCLAVYTYAACAGMDVSYLSSGLSPMTTDNTQVWTWDSYNYAKGTAYNKGLNPGAAHLFTPVLNLEGAESVSLTFTHVHRYTSKPSEDLTLWVTDNYQGSYDASEWKQLTISSYASGSDWKDWKTVSMDVPVSYVGTKTVFAFRYQWTSSSTGTWEVKNLNIESTCAGGELAPPVPLPELGEGRLRVFAQNLRNYYFHYDNYESTRANYDHAAFAKKTRQIVDVLMMAKADIFAFCELEAQPEVLVQLADSMNQRVDGEPFVAVVDGINVPWDEWDNNLKSGFIYNSQTVRPYGANSAATTASYYKNTMRIQAFEELSTKERFTLSMNHFKSKKTNSDTDDTNATRVTNANQLLSGLNNYAADPDILVLGDLNCTEGEDPITLIENAGFEEQLLRYDPSAFSHCYNYEGQLIDHAFANASMAEMITGAGVFHICSSCWSGSSANYDYRYSDHDAYMVAFNLPEGQAEECEDLDVTYLETGGSSLAPMLAEKISGSYNWQYDASYGAKCRNKGGENWLITPTYDLSSSTDISLSFQHAIGYRNQANVGNEQTLWVTKDFQGTVASSEWEQLTIPTYPTGSSQWAFVNALVNVPESMVGENTAFAFRFKVEASAANDPTWEIKNLKIRATCKNDVTALDEVDSVVKARKRLENGQLILILPDGTKYNGIGQKIR